MDNFHQSITVPKIPMSVCQFQIFETKQSRSGKGKYNFFMCLKRKAEYHNTVRSRSGGCSKRNTRFRLRV